MVWNGEVGLNFYFCGEIFLFKSKGYFGELELLFKLFSNWVVLWFLGGFVLIFIVNLFCFFIGLSFVLFLLYGKKKLSLVEIILNSFVLGIGFGWGVMVIIVDLSGGRNFVFDDEYWCEELLLLVLV